MHDVAQTTAALIFMVLGRVPVELPVFTEHYTVALSLQRFSVCNFGCQSKSHLKRLEEERQEERHR